MKGLGLFGQPGFTANGSPGGIRPMPRPAGLGGVEVERGARQGFLGPMSSQRYDMAMDLLKSAMAGAAGSTNPTLALLTPILGAVTGARLADKRDKALTSEQGRMTEALLGQPLNDQARQALDVLNNPDAPAYLKDIARTMFKTNAVPVGGVIKPARNSGGTAKPASGGAGVGRLVGEQWINGVLHGRDRNGTWHPYKTADGQLVSRTTPNAPPSATVVPPLPAPPSDPVLPSDPVGNDDDALINKYLGP